LTVDNCKYSTDSVKDYVTPYTLLRTTKKFCVKMGGLLIAM